ncbi:PX domain-containing protein [Diaporthe helianthi]|uniref:PX domain-containing protein n=1 Tax=Diaporthe helianthi TaxID=158607 RepID=A0A2P5HP32_DIAHE|nr:PX domain-containing protein [Diaporthe helianthi]
MAPPVEISIPTTSVNSPPDSKPFTQYNITLRLPLRSFVVQKRYSEFAALNDELVKTAGAGPPQPLPGKHWLKSTLSSPELTEDRRRGLEAYLRAIAESPDRRWRDTPASSGIGVGIEGRVPAINLHGPNAAAASDPTTWTDLYREIKGHLHEARLQLARRDAANDSGAGSGPGGKQGSTAAVEAGASAKRALVRAGSLLTALEGGLRAMGETKRLGEGELRRRRDLLAAARAERDGLEKLSSSLASARGLREGAPSSGDKATLLSGAGESSSRARTGGRVLGAPLPETERTRELDNVGVVQLQRQLMQEQDQDVEELAKIIRRQKEMGLAIKGEVEEQNEMFDQMDRDVDRIEAKMKVANSKARKLLSK